SRAVPQPSLQPKRALRRYTVTLGPGPRHPAHEGHSHRPEGDSDTMRLLAVHPSCLMYSKIYLRLEPLGLELVAAAARRAGHEVRLIDLQCESHQDFFRLVER